jgi:GATA-binding protein 4
MRKDGIQTRKRKPKKAGSGGTDVMGLVKKEDMHHHHIHHDDLKSTSTSDRNGNPKLLLSGSPKLHGTPKSHISPITHHHHHHPSQASYPLTSPMSSMHSSTVNSPGKYDLQSSTSNASLSAASSSSHAHSSAVSSHLYTSPLISSQSNLHSSYLHNNNLTSSSYGGIKSESNIPSHSNIAGITNPASISGNYDYMSNCIQNGYFAGSFHGSTPHADLSGYHHQHNVIQAAKLMATS